MQAPTVTSLYQNPAVHICPGIEECSSDPSSSPAPCWLPLDSTGVLEIAVLPFIIDEMAADCVGEGSVPRTAPVVLSVVDPQEV